MPRDDGLEPRLPGTARFAERVKLYFRNTTTSTEYEVSETRSNTGLSISSVKGALLSQNLSVPEDLGTGGSGNVLAGYATWKLGYLGANGLDPNRDDSNLDRDGDGRTNLQEYLAGTDPLDGNDNFGIRAVVRRSGITSVQFGPVRLRRVYGIFANPSLTDPNGWTRVGTFTPTANASFQWFDHLNPDATNTFYRVQVELQ